MDNKERDKKEILRLVAEYCNKYHKPKAFCEGDKIHYAARVYGEEEMTNLVDSALDFWLTSGEYTEKFENDFAAFLGVKKAFLVNSGSSANLLAFMALTSPLLGERESAAGTKSLRLRRFSDHRYSRHSVRSGSRIRGYHHSAIQYRCFDAGKSAVP